MNSTLKSLLFWTALFVVGLLIWNVSTRFQRPERRVSFSEFMTWVGQGSVAKVEIVGIAIVDAATLRRSFRRKLPNPRSTRFRSTILLSIAITTIFFCPSVCEAAPKVMSRRPGTPPRLLALFVLIRPNLGDRLAVIAPGFGGDFLHDDEKR